MAHGCLSVTFEIETFWTLFAITRFLSTCFLLFVNKQIDLIEEKFAIILWVENELSHRHLKRLRRTNNSNLFLCILKKIFFFRKCFWKNVILIQYLNFFEKWNPLGRSLELNHSKLKHVQFDLIFVFKRGTKRSMIASNALQ